MSDLFPDLLFSSHCFIFTISYHHVVNIIPAYRVVYIPTVRTETTGMNFEFQVLDGLEVADLYLLVQKCNLFLAVLCLIHCLLLLWQT